LFEEVCFFSEGVDGSAVPVFIFSEVEKKKFTEIFNLADGAIQDLTSKFKVPIRLSLQSSLRKFKTIFDEAVSAMAPRSEERVEAIV
jgi:hypothetical protein